MIPTVVIIDPIKLAAWAKFSAGDDPAGHKVCERQASLSK
jgi:hypothetical protein